MKKILIASAVLSALWLPLAVPAGAQTPTPPPNPSDLQAVAVNAYNAGYKAETARLEVPLAESTVRDAATASPTLNTASTSRDLLSLLVGALDLGDLSEDGQNLVLALNPKFFDLGSGQGSGKVTLHAPELFDAVAMKLPEDVRESRKQALVKGLDEFDDVEVAITWSKEGSRIGRDPSDYYALTSSLASELSAAPDADSDVEMTQRLLAALNQGADAATVERLAREAGTQAARSLANFHTLLLDSDFFKLGDLISNQPQLYIDATGRFRNDLLGRDEYGLTATWEIGFGNVNGLLKQDCAPDPALSREKRLAQVSPDCFKQFVAGHAQDWSKRVMLKVEYSKMDAYHLDLPDDDVTLDLDSAHTFRVTGGFGFDLAPLPEVGNSPARLELEAKYENVSDDEVRNDNRLVATLSYIQKMSESSSASLSLIYANKPELVGDVNQEVSAHVGLKFKMDTKSNS